MNHIDINSIVKIEQMPKVFSQLEKIGELIDKKTKDLDKLECTDENKQEVKNRRTEINKTLEALEDRRIEIKNKLLEPYAVFEEKYNKECKEKLQNASNLLKSKVDEIEKNQKQEKEEEIREFANQYIETYSLGNILSFEDIPLNITLSASIKSLKEQAKSFIEKIASDLKLIELEEYKSEILLEYNKNGYDFTKAKLDVITRHKQLEEIEKQQEEKEELQKQEEEVIEKVEEITIPVEVEEDVEEEFLTCTFTVKATRTQLKKLKAYLESEGITYGN